MGEVKDIEHDEKKAYDEAHKGDDEVEVEKADESLDETAEKIAEEVTEITEEAVEAPKRVKIAKAHSVFTTISEAEEGTVVEKKERKAFTLFPQL